MSGPSSIESFINGVLTDLKGVDETSDDYRGDGCGDRVDLGWLEACDVIKTHIKAGVPLKERVTITAEEVMTFFGEDEPREIARYLAAQLMHHRCVSLIKEIQEAT
jgi:hypothetical protein